MALNKFMTYILLVFSFTAFSESELPALAAKQSLSNLRFISTDGKFTYYQRKTGSFLFSTNYKVEEAIKLEAGTHFEVISSPDRKFVLVSAFKNYNNYYAPKALRKIFKIKWGTNQAKQIGEGIRPQIHLNDSYASFYKPFKRELHFYNIENDSISFFIKLANRKNPFFSPSSVFADDNTILYTDLNSDGIPGLLTYKLNTKKTNLFNKYESPLVKIEVCKKKGKVFIGRFGLDPINSASEIRWMPANDLNITQSKGLYLSKKNDLGHMICDIKGDFIYFVKNESTNQGKVYYEVAQLNINNGKTKIISDVKFATRIINMDGKLLIPYNGRYLVPLGENNMSQFDLLRAKE